MTRRALIRGLMIQINRIDGLYERKAAACAIKENMMCFLYALDDGSPHSQKQISEEWLIPRTTLNTIVKECKEKGLVTLEPIPGKRREQTVCLTPAGRAYARQSLDGIYAAEEAAFADAPVSREQLEALQRFSRALEKHFGE